jgi:hypothetical protein
VQEADYQPPQQLAAFDGEGQRSGMGEAQAKAESRRNVELQIGVECYLIAHNGNGYGNVILRIKSKNK